MNFVNAPIIAPRKYPIIKIFRRLLPTQNGKIMQLPINFYSNPLQSGAVLRVFIQFLFIYFNDIVPTQQKTAEMQVHFRGF